MAARSSERSEINVTPFVDVMLVLLIIFMVAAPLATTSLNLNMPAPGATEVVSPIPPVFVSLHANGVIHVGSEQLGESQGGWQTLMPLLREKSRGNLKAPVFVRADRDVNYGAFMRLVDDVRAAGYKNVSVVTENPDG